MNQPTTDKIRKIIIDLYECDTFTPASPLTGVMLDGDLVPWLASQADMLADDWDIVT